MMKRFLLSLIAALTCVPAIAQCCPEKPTAEKRQVLWQKLQEELAAIDKRLDGVMGLAVKDLTSGDVFFIHGDEIMPQASSIKIAVLANLYLQAQQGKLKLTEEYVVRSQDLVSGSDIMLGLTPGVTRLTLRDLATMMVAVSDNSATNVLIGCVGMENVNAMLDSLGVACNAAAAADDGPEGGGRGPRKRLHAARDDDPAGNYLSRQAAQ